MFEVRNFAQTSQKYNSFNRSTMQTIRRFPCYFRNTTWTWLLYALLHSPAASAQHTQTMEHNTNPLLCDPHTGMCELPGTSDSTIASTTLPDSSHLIQIIYFTDPICSSCWAIEPQLRKLKLLYGNQIQISYHMGGLLPDWSYNSGGISKPSDVAHHWDEVSHYYDMPIDGDVWLEDPLPSSYPPSIAFKAAEMQDKTKAQLFLRALREEVFLRKQNITRWEVIVRAAVIAGLDTAQLHTDYRGQAPALFQQDLQLAREMGVRGFPTLFFSTEGSQQQRMYGSQPFTAFETLIRQLQPEIAAATYNHEPDYLFTHFATLTAREFSELSGIPRDEAEKVLRQLTTEGKLGMLTTKNGNLWWKI